jgi:hypothetical protein
MILRTDGTTNPLTAHYSTGIPEAGNDSYSFQIYPNPAKDKVVISADFKYPLTGKSITVEMVDMVGKRIISSGQLAITGNKLVHELPLPASIADGTYLIKLNCNGAHFIKKIVVSR